MKIIEANSASELYSTLENLYGDLFLLGLAEITLESIYEGSFRDAGKALKRLQSHRSDTLIEHAIGCARRDGQRV